ETKSVVFHLTADDLALYNTEMQRVVEPGEFTVMIGASSNDIKLKGSFVIEDH
ncbi:MAG: fibronectin type III-like domain-contianing protein, partial [Fermentimonas sp.]|nr:fibronectin type III-like domain-contianing protein [Fermentimonas sp.]